MKFDNKPLYDEEDVKHRLIIERMALIKSDLPVKTLLNYWSETTGECHCFPVFKTDKPMDIMNRYSDVFSEECADNLQMVKDMNSSLYNENAMSKERLNMAKFKVPIIVWRAMMELDPNFWDDSGMEWYENNIKKLKIGHRA